MTDESSAYWATLLGQLSDRDYVTGYPDPDGWVSLALHGFPWDIAVKVTEVDGIPELTALRLEPRTAHFGYPDADGTRVPIGAVDATDAVVTSERLRSLPLRLIANVAAAVLAGGEPEKIAAVFESERVNWPQGRPRPDEHYKEVANVYRAALAWRQPPVKAIEERWVVGRAMASRYVAEARKRGYLDYPSRPGVAGTGSAESPVKKKTAPKKARKRTTKRGK